MPKLYLLSLDKDELELVMQSVALLRCSTAYDIAGAYEAVSCHRELASEQPDVLRRVAKKLITLGTACAESIV